MELVKTDLKNRLDEIDEKAIQEGMSPMLLGQRIVKQNMWLKGREIIKDYPELVGRGGEGVSPPSYRDIARQLKRDNHTIKKWVDLVQEVGETKEEFNIWIVPELQRMKDKWMAGLKAIESKQDTIIEKLPTDKYNIIYADPPWHYPQNWEHFGQNVERHYNTLTDEQLKELNVSELLAPDCVIYLWITSPKLPVGIEILNAWGFDYKTCLIWDKVKHNMGFYASIRHEILLIGGKGQSAPTDKSYANQTDSVYSEERTEHSKKPEFYYEMIERMHPTKTKKIELFARQPHEGWEVWGNEV